MDIVAILYLLNEYSGLVTAFSLVTAGLWAVLKFREATKDKRFQTYHDLIDQMVNEQRNIDRAIKLDRQIAVIFELRNFSNYYPLTQRILTDLKITWKDPRIVREIDLTLDFISRSWIEKAFLRFWKK